MDNDKITVFKGIYEPIIVILVLFDVLLLLISIFYSFPVSVAEEIIYFDLFVCILLFLEFLYNFKQAEDKKDFLKHNWVDLVAAIPFDFFLLRCFRLIRLIRVIRVIRLARVFLLFKKDLELTKKFIINSNLGKLFVAIVFIVILASLTLFFIDPNMENLLTSFWYVISTITSVGYGDVVPSSVAGKIIGIFLIIIGLIILSIFIGTVSSIYESRFYREENVKLENTLDNLENKISTLTDVIEKQNMKINDLENKISNLNKRLEYKD